MRTAAHSRTHVFISYSHKDKDWLERLRVHLRPLEKQLPHLEIWDDTRIRAGSKWRREIETAIAQAKVAILLVSADFLASDFITHNELPPLLLAAERDGATILPVILSPSRFHRTPSLSQFQSVNEPSQPLINMQRGEQELILVKVADTIDDLLAADFGPHSQARGAAGMPSLLQEPNVKEVNAASLEIQRDRRRISSPTTDEVLHFIWLCDCSRSMGGSKIQALNNAIREGVPHLQMLADENPHARLFVRAVAFANNAWWHLPEPTPIEGFRWVDLHHQETMRRDVGMALALIAEQLTVPPMSKHAFPPVLVLVTDGKPTDDFATGVQLLMDVPWGKKAVRLALAIGAYADHEALRPFTGNPELFFQAHNPEAWFRHIRWVSETIPPSNPSEVW